MDRTSSPLPSHAAAYFLLLCRAVGVIIPTSCHMVRILVFHVHPTFVEQFLRRPRSQASARPLRELQGRQEAEVLRGRGEHRPLPTKASVKVPPPPPCRFFPPPPASSASPSKSSVAISSSSAASSSSSVAPPSPLPSEEGRPRFHPSRLRRGLRLRL